MRNMNLANNRNVKWCFRTSITWHLFHINENSNKLLMQTLPYPNTKAVLKQLYLLKASQLAVKGYLCYQMITSRNVSSDAQVKNFFHFLEKMFCSQDIQVLVFSTISWFTQSVMSSISTRDPRCSF